MSAIEKLNSGKASPVRELNTVSRVEAIEIVAGLFMRADSLVVDLAQAPGYPSMMVLVKDCMPLFIFVRPDDMTDEHWQFSKETVEKNLAAVNATWFDVKELADLDWVLGEVMHRTKPGEIKRPEQKKQPTAEQQGFDFEQKRDRKAWLK